MTNQIISIFDDRNSLYCKQRINQAIVAPSADFGLLTRLGLEENITKTILQNNSQQQKQSVGAIKTESLGSNQNILIVTV